MHLDDDRIERMVAWFQRTGNGFEDIERYVESMLSLYASKCASTDDGLQEARIKLLECCNRYDGTIGVPFRAYLKRCLRPSRREELEVLPILTEEESEDGHAGYLEEELPNGCHGEVSNLFLELVKSGMTKRQWEIYKAVEIDGITEYQLAEQQGVSPNNVFKVLYRAKLMARERIVACYTQDELKRLGVLDA